jgi:hypothetical protein
MLEEHEVNIGRSLARRGLCEVVFRQLWHIGGAWQATGAYLSVGT